MNAYDPPAWVRHLDDTDLHFIKRMVLASGSLKQLAQDYEVSYPTIRTRLDRIIQRVQSFESNPEDDPFEARVRILVAERTLDLPVARQLLALHRQSKETDHD